jgi:hypothetical protein
MANTRLRRWVQVIGASGLSASTRPCPRRGTIQLRYLPVGANTRATASLPYCLRCEQDVRSLSPALWQRVRFNLGWRSTDNRLVAMGGRVIWRHRRSRRARCQAAQTVAAWSEKTGQLGHQRSVWYQEAVVG